MRVLIVKMSALGDIIHALPVLDYLHRVSPGIEIDWVVEDSFLDIVAGNPMISRIHVVRKKAWRGKPMARETWREMKILRDGMRERSYDMVFDIQGNMKSGVVCFSSGSDTRYGFTGEVLQERLNLLFTTKRVPIKPQDSHVTDQYLRLVSNPFGQDFSQMELTSDIYTSHEDDAAAKSLLAGLNGGLVFLFHYGTTWQTKFWTTENWTDLGTAVLDRFPDSSILFSWGNESERATVTAIASAIGSGGVVIERYSLKGLTALLKQVDMVVGGDTGPVHLAAAVGTPTVSLYRSSVGRRSGPRGKDHVIIQSPLHCAGCFRTKCERDAECRESISVAAVLAGVERIFTDVHRQSKSSARVQATP